MTKAIDYYFWINSDWAYLGHSRLVELAKRQGVAINYMPVDLPYVYSQTGGILLGQRSQERQAYRITELARWCKRLGIPVNPQPRYMCPNGDLASCMVISAKHAGLCEGTLAQAILHAEWLEDQDISSPETLQTIARSLDLDGEALLSQAASPVIKAEYRQYTDNAISAGVFGSPAYVYRGEVFWGQDRLDFLEDTLACT